MDIYEEWKRIKLLKNSKRNLDFLRFVYTSSKFNADQQENQVVKEIFEEILGQLIDQYEKSRKILPERSLESLEILATSRSSLFLKQHLCQLYNSLGNYFRSCSKLKTAKQYYEKGVLLAEKSKDLSLVQCYLILNLSCILSDLGNHQESLKIAKIAVNYSQEMLLQMRKDCSEKDEMVEAVCISYHTIV